MKLPAAFVAITLAAGAAACARAQAETSSAAAPAAEAPAVADISVSGCLERDAEGAFVVTRISAVSRRAPAADASTPASAAAQHATPKAFQIGPDRSQVLASVVGQWVNVSGSLRGESHIDATVVSVLGDACGAPPPSNGGQL